MKHLLTAILFLLSYNGYTQCKYSVDETDRFTGKQKLETKREKVFSSMTQHIEFSYGKADSLAYIVAKTGHYTAYYVGSNHKLTIIFSGGSKMILDRTTATEVSTNIPNTSQWVNYSVWYLNEDELFQLQNKKISEVRIETSQGYIETDGPIKPKQAIKLLETAKCI